MKRVALYAKNQNRHLAEISITILKGKTLLTTRQASNKTTNRKNRDVHGLALVDKIVANRIIVVAPQRICIVTNIATGYQ